MSALAECVGKLHSIDEADRFYAAEDIGYLNDGAGVPPLLDQLLKEPSRAVRDVIFQALIRIEADAAIIGCIQLLSSEDPQLRNQAVDVLRHKGAASIPYLTAVMRDGDRDLRKLVLDALSNLRIRDADDIYSAALSDEDQNVVISAVESLGKIRAEEFRGRIEDLLTPDAHPMRMVACIEALVAIGNTSSLTAIRRCFPQLARLPDFLLAPCLKAMAELGSDEEFAEIAELIVARGPQLQPAMLSALLAIHPHCQSPPANERLLHYLRAVIENDEAPLCRHLAVRLVAHWAGRDDMYAFVVSCLSSADRSVRLGAAESLMLMERPGRDALLAAHRSHETDEEILDVLQC